MELLERLAEAIRDANPNRSIANLNRRILKLIEEYGEATQAYLNVTSPANAKNKTWADVREELTDCFIVAVDIGWTLLSGETELATVLPPILPESAGLPFSEGFLLHFGVLLGQFINSRGRDDLARIITAICYLNLTTFADLDQPDQIERRLEFDINRKLEKWDANRKKMKIVTHDV
jgi:NTP pyrophosphatase (non-canonical NTP hydrolase)